ncbi:hypothetical protein D3C80_1663460 [compost metagenome]
MQPGRCVVEQPLQRLDDLWVLQVMQIIEHQHQVARMLPDALHQGDDPMLNGHFAIVAAQQKAGIAHQLRVYFG